MDVARTPILLSAFSVALAAMLFHSSPARAYDEYSHEWITREAFSYLKANPHIYPETRKWLEDLDGNEPFLEETLVRAVVDTDYKTDIWLSAWFHGPLDGGESGELVAMFTTMFHFLTVTSPGEYWQYDGYSYKHSTQQGNDSYLNEPTLKIQGDESTALGGSAPAGHKIHGAELGIYDVGFIGDREKWKKLFFDSSASEAVFPPSFVPAEIAYDRLLSSSRAASDVTDSWSETSHLVTSLFGTDDINRDYWRGEVAGLPQYLDLLGLVMHLTQDTTVPHHVQDTSDNCHPEYERRVDQLACHTDTALDYTIYYKGDYGSGGRDCSALYDSALVNKILADQELLDPAKPLSIQDRMIRSALLTSQWDWRIQADRKYATVLPSGQFFQSNECNDILSQKAVQEQAKYQFNLAVAQTVAVFELAAHQYETLHAEQSAPLPTALSWFQSLP